MNPISRSRFFTCGLVAAAALATCTLCAAFGESATGNMPKMADPSQLTGLHGGESARPAVGVPLMAAEGLIKDSHFAEAMAKVREAERAVPEPTRYERYAINRTKAAAAMGAGQPQLAFEAIEAAIDTKQLSGNEQSELIASLVHAAYSAKDYARAVRWADRYAAEGGTRSDIAPLRTQALYLGGDFAGAAAALRAQVQADDAAGRVTSERELQLLASAQRKLGDEAAVLQTLERLTTRYPKPSYWADLLSRVDRKTLSERLFLDLLRITRVTGNLPGGEDNVLLAELALQAGFGGEALAVLDDASARGLLKDSALAKAQASRAKAAKLAREDAANRKRDETSARAAKDGNGLVLLGESAVGEGRLDAGIALIEAGLAKGGVHRVEEHRLRLGEAQALAGRKDAAQQTLAAVKGGEGLTELAHLWWLYAGVTPAPTTPVAAAQPAASAAH